MRISLSKARLLTLHGFTYLAFASAYTIENCGSHTSNIEYAVTLAQTAMIKPLHDIRQNGIASDHGFRALYKTPASIPFVKSLLLRVLHLPPAPVDGHDLAPVFMCAVPDVMRTQKLEDDPWTLCHSASTPPVTAFWVKDSATVVLCPAFRQWLRTQPSLSPDRPVDIYCPTVNNNLFIRQSDPLVRYHSYVLVLQLLRLYLGKLGLGGASRLRDWNGCVGLGAGLAERNSMSAVYYAACECFGVCRGVGEMG